MCYFRDIKEAQSVYQTGGAHMPATTFIEPISHNTQSRPFSIHYTKTQPGLYNALYVHYHSEMEFFYLEKGALDLYIEDLTFHLTAGNAVFIPQNLIHSAERISPPDEDCCFYALVFSDKMLMDTLPKYCNIYIQPVYRSPLDCIIPLYGKEKWQKDVINLLKEIFESKKSDINECELTIRGRLLIIWQLLYNNHMKFYNNNLSDNNSFPQIQKCINYIQENYAENISLDELAGNAGFSTGHFCRLFKSMTGFTPFSYLNRIRIAISCGLLLETDKKISEIAALCGYNNVSYYNRTFTKIMKETPSGYRRHLS